MAHEITNIDSVILRGQQAWHGLGVVIQDDLTAMEAARRFGMLWPVGQWKLEAVGPNGQRMAVDSHVANVREQDCDGNAIEHLLGVVGADYQVCPNRELAEFVDALAQTGQVTIETCGSIRGGKRVWFLAKSEVFEIGGVDKVYPYVLASNGHDGTQSIRITPTSIRAVCSNTLHMVIPASDVLTRPESAAIAIRHTGRIMDKLEEAKRAMRYYGETLKRNRELFEAMQSKKLEREQVMRLFSDSYSAFWQVATKDELASTDEKLRVTAERRMERMRNASDTFMARYEEEQKNLGLGDTAWAAFNAMSGFLQHDKTARGSDDQNRVERRIESNLFGLNAYRTHEVLAATLALAG